MFYLQRVGPTVAGGIDRTKKLQLLKNTGKLGVCDIIRSWYLQFTESYKFAHLKKNHPTCAYSHADTEFMQAIKKQLINVTLQKFCIYFILS